MIESKVCWVRVAGSRWAVGETFQFAKNETGTDRRQVREYHAWHWPVTPLMFAAAFVVPTAHAERARTAPGTSARPQNT